MPTPVPVLGTAAAVFADRIVGLATRVKRVLICVFSGINVYLSISGTTDPGPTSGGGDRRGWGFVAFDIARTLNQ